MDMKLRIWLLVLFAVMTSGDDPKNSTVSSIGGDDTAAGDVPTKKDVAKDILAVMKGELMKPRQTDEREKYDPLCDSKCTDENRFSLPYKCNGIKFNPRSCEFYKSGEHLSCYACPKDPKSGNLDDCPSNNDKTDSLPWPCKGHYSEDDHQNMFYNGFKHEGDPVCSKQTTTVSLPNKEILYYNVRTCSLHVGEPGCNATSPKVVKELDEMFKAAYGPMAKVTQAQTCFCKSNNCNGNKVMLGRGVRLAGSYYDIGTLGLGLAAIMFSYNAHLTQLI